MLCWVVLLSSLPTVTQNCSSIWNYFSVCIDDEMKVICKECLEKVAHGGTKTKSFSTPTMLQIHQPDELKGLMEGEKATAKSQASSSAGSLQVTIQEYLEKFQPFLMIYPTTWKITILIGEMMALDCQPFSIVKVQGFVLLPNQLQPC